MDHKPLWRMYELALQFEMLLCGSVPQSKELIAPWLAARAPEKVPAAVVAGDAPTLAQLEEEVAASVDNVEERITLGFQVDGSGLFVRNGTLKAHLKDCGDQVKKYLDIKALRSKIANRVFVEPYRLFLMHSPDGPGSVPRVIEKEDGEFERAVHVMTPLGPRNALKRIRFVYGPSIAATLRVLTDTEITENVLRTVLDYGSVHGYGGERGMGEGRYTYTLVERP